MRALWSRAYLRSAWNASSTVISRWGSEHAFSLFDEMDRGVQRLLQLFGGALLLLCN